METAGNPIAPPLVPDPVAEAGVEQPVESSENTPVSSRGGAESGALDPELATLLELWPSLSPPYRALVIEVARGANHLEDTDRL